LLHEDVVALCSAGSSPGMSVTLTLDRAPVTGLPVLVTVTVTNTEAVAKVIKVHLNAQAKQYNNSPSDTFWEDHSIVNLAPLEGKLTALTIMSYTDILNICQHLCRRLYIN